MTETSDAIKGKKVGQKERFLQELSHLEKAHKSGIVPLQEYKQVKQVLEKKLASFENQAKQDAAKEKVVHDLLGQSLTPGKKGSEKYFIKIDKGKEALLISAHKTTKAVKDSSKKLPKKETGKSLTEKSIVAPFQQKEAASSGTVGTLPSLPSRELSKEHTGAMQDIPVIPQHHDPSSVSPAISQESHTFKDIEDLVDDQEPHWRLGFVMLTIFLLILLYVKFTSFGVVDTAVSIDAYLDYSSSYSHETYANLQEILVMYSDRLLVSYHLVGSGEQNALASAAIACAEDQEQGTAYLQSLFSKDPANWETADDLLFFAEDIGLDTSLFQLCMEGDVKSMRYNRDVNDAFAADIMYTPTLVINSKKIVGAVGIEAIQQVINSELTALG